jgi:hypothetical protein
MSAGAFEKAARRIGCDAAVIRAVWEVESAGKDFLPDRTVIRRFEPHAFPKEHWSQIGYSVRSGEQPWRASLRIPQAARERMFLQAYRINPEAALRAASWGGSQIMGFNHKKAGSPSAIAMVTAMAESADAQMAATIALLDAWGLTTALRAHDWLAIARAWNGTGQPEVYAARMEAAYRRWARVQTGAPKSSAVVLRVGARGSEVRALQRALGIIEDGAFGPATRDALIAFQEKNGLVADGVAGAKTWAALAARTKTPVPIQRDRPSVFDLVRHALIMFFRLQREGA